MNQSCWARTKDPDSFRALSKKCVDSVYSMFFKESLVNELRNAQSFETLLDQLNLASIGLCGHRFTAICTGLIAFSILLGVSSKKTVSLLFSDHIRCIRGTWVAWTSFGFSAQMHIKAYDSLLKKFWDNWLVCCWNHDMWEGNLIWQMMQVRIVLFLSEFIIEIRRLMRHKRNKN